MRKSLFCWISASLFFVGVFCCWLGFRPHSHFLDRKTVLRLDAEIPDKVLICGVCRNIEKAIPNTIASIHELGSHFVDYRAIIYENNSTDQTKSLMQAWANSDPHVMFFSEQLSTRHLARQLEMKVCNRTEKIARARNIVLDEAMKKSFDDYKYVIWADLDFLEPWDVESIVETILRPEQDWDAVLAYGAYDLFALRSQELPIGVELLGSVFWKELETLRSRFQLDVKGPWKQVYSAFGGLGIYKRDSIRGCRYSGVVTQDMERLVSQWLSQARQTGKGCLLKEYEELLLNTKIVDLSGPFLQRREEYPADIGVRMPGGSVVWFSCMPKDTLPWTCEHVPFHASMILRGHDRIFINPKIRNNP